MLALNAFRRRVLISPDPPSPDASDTKRTPGLLPLAIATAIVYAICNAPADKLLAYFDAHRWWSGWLAPTFITPEQFVRRFVIPLKGLLFAIALVCLFIPIVRAIRRGLCEIDRTTLRRSLWTSLALFAFCWLLAWPYQTAMWAVGNWGTFFARMSEDPFGEPHDFFHRRLLKPALAYLLQFRGPLLYWVFSILCAAVLSFLIVLYFEIALTRRVDDIETRVPDRLMRTLAALGVMCTNLLMLHLTATGYVDDVVAILILLQIVLPLTLRARLCLVVLTMATHEAAAVFGLGPLVLVLFSNWRDRLAAWFVMGSFFIFWLASYGFDLPAAFAVHTKFGAKTDTFHVFRQHVPSLLLGVFMAHKFFWGVFVAALWRLIDRRDWEASLALVTCTLVPLGIIPIATDTSRLVGMGFAGVLFSVVILLPELRTTLGQRLFALVCVLSIAVPYYPSGGAWLEVPAGGYYKAFYKYFQAWFWKLFGLG